MAAAFLEMICVGPSGTWSEWARDPDVLEYRGPGIVAQAAEWDQLDAEHEKAKAELGADHPTTRALLEKCTEMY